jgi:hypothetical protein
MNFKFQTGTRDCFPTCFNNAMLHFEVPIVPVLMKRLEIFRNGTENCTIYASEERLEQYERSIHKFISEWNWAYRHRNDKDRCASESEEWTEYLLKMGINLEFKNGPIEQRDSIAAALSKNSIAICEIWIPSATIPNSEYKHFVLIVNLVHNKLLIHDPLLSDWDIRSDKVEYRENEYGSNFEIDYDYFFSNEVGPLKPKPNQFQTDWGYKFIVVSKTA